MKKRMNHSIWKRTGTSLLAAALVATSVQYASADTAYADESAYQLTPAQAFAIGNGDFTNGTDMWTTFEAPWTWGAYDVAADWTTDQRGMVVDIQNTGVFHYDWNDFDNAVSYPEWLIALNQENVSLTAGYTYDLSLQIESTIDRTVKIGLESLDGSWYLWESQIPLQTGRNVIDGIHITPTEDFTGTFFIQMGHNEQDAGTSYAEHQLVISDVRLEAQRARDAYVLVKDSDFTDHTSFTTSGAVSTDQMYVAANVTDLGTVPNSTNLTYTSLPVTAGETYLLQFAGRAEQERLIQVQLGEQVVADAVALHTYTDTYQYEFTAETTGIYDLTFDLGNVPGAQTGMVYLDNIGLWSKATDAALNVSFFQPEISLSAVALSTVKDTICEGDDAAFTYSCDDTAAWEAAPKHLYVNRAEVDSRLVSVNNGQVVVNGAVFEGAGVYKVAIRAEGFENSNQAAVTVLPGNGNLLLNGSFEDGLSDWTFYSLNNSSSATLTDDFGLKISNIWWDQWSWDNNPPYYYVEWQTMLNQSVNLEAGKSYTVAFTASSTSERPILVALKNMSGSGTYVTLTNTPTEYQVTLNENWTEATELQFSFGYITANGVSVDEENPAHDITISDIVMTESTNTPVVYYPVIGGVENGAIYRNPVTPKVHLKDSAYTVTLYQADGNGNYVQVPYTDGEAISELGSYKLVVSSVADPAVKTTKTFTVRDSSYNYEKQYYVITSRHNSMALTAAGVTNGAAVTQSVYEETDTSYYFSREYVSGNYFVLRNASSDLVVSVKGDSNDNAAKLVMTTFDASDKYQQWSLLYVSQGFYSLINRGSGKAIDVPSASYDSGVQLQQYDSNASNAQQWDIIAMDMKSGVEGEPIPDTSTVELWQKNAIIYPLEKNLEPTGPVMIQWYNTIPGVASYEVKIDEEEAVTVPATEEPIASYEWYSVDVDTHTVTVTAVLSNGTRIATDLRTFYLSKKGACWATLHRTDDLHIGWYYNWGTHTSVGTDKNLDYAAMTWGNGANIGDTVQTIVDNGYTTLLGFNEPDGVDQSNVSAAEALASWKYLSASGLRLGSPCTAIPAPYTNADWLKTSTSFTYNWFYDFMDGIEADDELYIDFIAIHDYDGSGDPQSFINMLEETHRQWPDYPLWITEFGVAEWSEGLWSSNEDTVAQVKYFMETVIDYMDQADYIERYAWFPFDPNDAWGGASGIFNYDTGKLNELGELYASLGLPEEYYNLVYGITPITPPVQPEPIEDTVVENVAAHATATASTENQPASNAIDGNADSRWESENADPQWICLDLGASYPITEVTIDWETAAGKEYTIQVSEDGENWNDVYTVTDGISGASLDAKLAEPANGRYVRVYGTSRTTGYGYSIFEMGVYAQVNDQYYNGMNLALNKKTTVSSGDGAQAVDGNVGSRWESAFTDEEFITVDLGKNYRLDTVNLIWENAYAAEYTIDVSEDGINWKTVYTEHAGDGENDTISLTDVTGRYVRMNGVKRATGYGYSLWEMEVYGGVVGETLGETKTAFPFTDVKETAWYYDTVKEVYELGLMTGFTETTFAPSETMTRAMVATVLYRMAGSPETAYEKKFPDVAAGKYYSEAVTWAAENGVVSGFGDGKFKPGTNVTREQMVKMLYNYAETLGLDTSARADLTTYKDGTQVSNYAKDPMRWAIANGILSGTASGELKAKSNATRAEVAKMLLNFYQLLKK